MPIECAVELKYINQDDFHQLDKQVMADAFAIHNSMGRFFDERIYQTELAARCHGRGITSYREVELKVSHGEFAKSYFLDLLVAEGCIYELKTATSLSSAHQKQLIHYLLLAGLNHGKLINFRSSSVESRFVSTRLTAETRRGYSVNDQEWSRCDSRCDHLKETLLSLLNDWGAFLEVDLYKEALLHLTKAPDFGLQPVPIVVNRQTVGQQKLCLLSNNCAWHLSAISQHFDSYQVHIERLLNHTSLTMIHWINFDRQRISLKTLFK